MLYLDIIFIVIFSAYLYWFWGLLRALKSDAPYVPITHRALSRLLDLAGAKAGDTWIDLGSGDGRILIAAVQRLGVRGIGIERVGALRILSRLKIWRAGLADAISIRRGDFFSYDLAQADIVSFYLLPETNRRLIEKFRRELRPDTKLISHRFSMDGADLTAYDPEVKIYVTTVDKLKMPRLSG